jgi:hypothetical protein
LTTAQTVQTYLEQPFESMENLLMTISPMFRDRFQQELYNKLQSVQQQQPEQQTAPHNIIPNSHPQQQPSFMANPNTNTANQNNNNTESFDGLDHWIN